MLECKVCLAIVSTGKQALHSRRKLLRRHSLATNRADYLETVTAETAGIGHPALVSQVFNAPTSCKTPFGPR